MPNTDSPVVIVGAGISGLALGHYLSQMQVDGVVLEASAVAGGVIRTHHCGSQVLELGPQRTRLTKPLRELIECLQLADHLVVAPELPLYVYASGSFHEVPVDVRSLLTTNLLSWTDRLRALAEPLTRGVTDGESAADFFIRKFGHRTYVRLFGPLFGDLFGSDPADMPARHALAAYLRTFGVDGSLLYALVRRNGRRNAASACSFRFGLQTLTDALALRLGDRLRTSTPVRAIYRNGAGFDVETDKEVYEASHVALTCPASAASRMLAPLGAEWAACCAQLRYNALAVVHLHSTAKMNGMGFQVTLDSGYATRGVTCNDALFDRRGLYTAFLGGAMRRGISELPDREVGSLAAKEFKDLTGSPCEPLAVHRTQMPAWDSTWNAIEGWSVPQGISICANWRGRAGITGRLEEAQSLAETLADQTSRASVFWFTQ